MRRGWRTGEAQNRHDKYVVMESEKGVVRSEFDMEQSTQARLFMAKNKLVCVDIRVSEGIEENPRSQLIRDLHEDMEGMIAQWDEDAGNHCVFD